MKEEPVFLKCVICCRYFRDDQGIKSRRVNLEAKPEKKYEDRLYDNFNLVFGKTPKWADLNRVLGDGNVKVSHFTNAVYKVGINKLVSIF